MDNPKSCTTGLMIYRVLNIPVGSSQNPPRPVLQTLPRSIYYINYSSSAFLKSCLTSIRNIFGWTSFLGVKIWSSLRRGKWKQWRFGFLQFQSIFDRPSRGYHSQLVERTPAEELAQIPQGRPIVERYREFVTTHSERIYPEYLLAVRRVQEREVHF